jgi:hypothetical protein
MPNFELWHSCRKWAICISQCTVQNVTIAHRVGPFAAVHLRSPFFWDIARCHSVFGIRRFETALISHLQGSSYAVDVEISTLEEETITLSRIVSLQLPSDTAPYPWKRETSAY